MTTQNDPHLANAERGNDDKLRLDPITDPVLTKYPGFWLGPARSDARWLARERAREALLRGLLGEGKP